MMIKRYYIALFVLLFSVCMSAQPNKLKNVEPADAEEHFKNHNYIMAIPVYKELLKKEPDNMDFNYKLGLCYLRTHIYRPDAIKYMEIASKQKKFPVEGWFYLGRAYHINHKLDKAIETYAKYEEQVGKDKEALAKAEHMIQMCHNGQQLMKFPINVTFTNLGNQINGPTADYFPFITADEQTLFFTSRRKGGHASSVESDGYFSSDVFMSTALDGKWDVAKNLGSSVNTKLDEEIVGLKPDGSQLIIYIDHIDKLEDLYTTFKKTNGYGKLEPLSENINKEKEYSGTIAETENGPVLFFVRRGKECIGETDIFMSRMLPNMKWGLPINLGPNINTKFREDFPYLSPDGRTLYFSSEGHSSMGGFDLFKSSWDDESQSWSAPQNLGYPLNTADDEQQICILQDQTAAYVTALRPEGFGDYDIYRIKFEDEEQKFSIYRGKVIRSDSSNTADLDATITATNLGTKEEFFFKPVSSTGKYIMALQPGKYEITIEMAGYKSYTEKFQIFDFGRVKPETLRNFILQKNDP